MASKFVYLLVIPDKCLVRILPSRKRGLWYGRIFLNERFSSLIGSGLCFLIVFPPLAFGAVYPWAFSIVELVCFSLLIVWLIERRRKAQGARPKCGGGRPSFYLPFGIFVGLLLFQMLPMPPVILRTISPQTYRLYCETLDGYGSNKNSRESPSSAEQMGRRRDLRLLNSGDRVLLGRGEAGEDLQRQARESKKFFRTWRSLSVYPYATRVELLKILAYAGAFYLILAWTDSRSRLLRLLYLMVFMGSLTSIVGMFQRFIGADRIYGLWEPVFKTDNSFFGPYVNPNHFAGYVVLIIPVAVALFVRQIERIGWGRGRTPRDYLGRLNEEDFHAALFILLALVLMVSGLFLSLSRGGIFAMTGSIIFMVAVLSVKGGWRWVVGVGFVTGLFVALFLFWLGFVPFQAEVKTLENLLQDSNVQGRLRIWSDVWRMFLDFPLFGTGFGTFAHVYPKYKTILGQATVLYPESDFLAVLVETGLVGFGALIGFFVVFCRASWIRWKHQESYVARINPKVMIGLAAGLVALLIHGIGDFNLHIPANALQFAIVMALVVRVQSDRGNVKGR